MEARERTVLYYVPRDNSPAPFRTWRDGITDTRTKLVVTARIARLRGGNFGDSRPIGHGASENRIDFGPGYRIYYGIDGQDIVLLYGGDKSSQLVTSEQRRISGRTIGSEKMKRNEDYKADLLEELRSDPDYAAEYLSAAKADSNEAFLVALRDVAEARMGMKKVAKAAEVNRENLYRALSRDGNPRIGTIDAVLDVLGIENKFVPKRVAAGGRRRWRNIRRQRKASDD